MLVRLKSFSQFVEKIEEMKSSCQNNITKCENLDLKCSKSEKMTK